MKLKTKKGLLACVCGILAMLTFNSCQESDFSERFAVETDISGRKVSNPVKNNVNIEDVAALCGVGKSATRGTSGIECIVDEANDTLLYIYNKPEGGWIVFSSDARVPAIIAESDRGSFDAHMENDNAKLWLESIAGDLKLIKTLDDAELNFSYAEINDNRGFWMNDSLQIEFCADVSNLNEDVSVNGNKDLPPIQYEPKGHYEYSGTSFYTEVFDSVPRMILTDWHQDYPYNNYCPYKSNGIGRAPAGCTAIAGGQMLFFLHNKYGVPRTAPSKAYCYGNIKAENFNYNWGQTDYNSEIWNEMWYNDAAAAPLIADIGRRLKSKYGDEDTSSVTADLVTKVFAPYGIDAVCAVYNEDEIRRNLINGLPVIISARSIDPKKNSETAGHAFIVDRYKRVRVRCEYRYQWVYDPLPGNTGASGPIIDAGYIKNMPDSVVISYRSPEINMIGMNWGWGSLLNDGSEWYSLTGDWIKIAKYEYNFNISRHMIYINSINFSGL